MPNKFNSSRRDFLTKTSTIAAVTAASTVGILNSKDSFAATKPLPKGVGDIAPAKSVNAIRRKNKRQLKRPNILFILTDQESFMTPEQMPKDYTLPGREKLKKSGISFTNHYINSAVCTSSRSVIYTGRHIQETGMVDNVQPPIADITHSLSHDFPTPGNLLTDNGYYCVYKGKWHLSENMESRNPYATPTQEFNEHMKQYGFQDYAGIGDVIGKVSGGYRNDELTAIEATRWLRLRGQSLNESDTPWFLNVSLTNPHDVMFYNTDKENESVQTTPKPLSKLTRDPENSLFNTQWDIPVPISASQKLSDKNTIKAHQQYQECMGMLVGKIPLEKQQERINRRQNYYFNCIKETDRLVERLLNELEALGLAEDTIIVMTSDHGELGGAHGMTGKGSTAYQEQLHVPMIISHPDFTENNGQECNAITSHIDLMPTLLDWSQTKVDYSKQKSHLGVYKGYSMTPLLKKGKAAQVSDLRESILYNFNMTAYLDPKLFSNLQTFVNNGGTRKEWLKKGLKLDASSRGAMRTVFDGRYKFSRYFSPLEHHTPKNFTDLTQRNDLELFDLKEDPHEMNNLALQADKQRDLIMLMNDKLNHMIKSEVAVKDDGHFMPLSAKTSLDSLEYDI